MTQRLLGPTGGRRRRRLLLLLPFVVLAALFLAIGAGAVGNESGFEDDDGNLAPNAAGLNFDWNSFAPTTWTGTAPYRTSSKTVSGWTFTGLEDAQALTSDTAFAGGTKQNDECASVGGQKASNKDDLKRVYFASKTVNGHVYLNLAWVRIPQQTTSSSAHVAFEFNQSTSACPAGSDSLVHRSTANGGDVLIVYDFEGGAATPTIRLSRWIASGSCEVGTTLPCWSVAQTLGAGVAEAAVNTGTTVSDAIAPPPPTPPVLLADSEFGEAGIDLTDAGVFTSGQCVNFGSGFAVSRSSGNSGQAQMKDLVGPGVVNIKNCGTVNIHKQDDLGAPLAGAVFTLFTDNAPVDGLPPHGAEDVATSFTCTTDASGDCSFGNNVPFGNYWAVETTGVPGHDLAADQSFSLTTDTPNLTISLTFVDPRQLGAIRITKTAKHAGPNGSANLVAGFTITDSNGGTHTVSTDATGNACVGGLPPGAATVSETTPPAGYSPGPDQSVTVVSGTTCANGDGVLASFTNIPLTNITISVHSQVVGGTSSTIDCGGGATGSTDGNGDGSVSRNDLAPGTYTCTVVIDP
jgi:Prealbumin-like fold domain